MQFEKGYLYHIYNQGNNKQKIFFNRKNYLFFLWKIKQYILPYCDILAWCLMPNHFHLMVLVNEITVGFAPSEAYGLQKKQARASLKTRSINQSIGIMLRSYTNAINKELNRSGALFRQKTKANCINCQNGITLSFIKENGITKINITQPEKQYPQICFDYIHQNPQKAGLVKSITDWEYSSATDFAGLREGKLINKKVADKYINY